MAWDSIATIASQVQSGQQTATALVQKSLKLVEDNKEFSAITMPDKATRAPSFWLGKPTKILQGYTSEHKNGRGVAIFTVQDIETGKTELLQTLFTLS